MRIADAAINLAATARITRLAVDDEITRPARELVEELTGPDSRLTYLVNCPACTSVWAGVVVQVLPRWARIALALSSGTLAVRWAAEVTEGAI